MAQLAPPLKSAPGRVPARAANRPPLQAKLEVGPAGDHFEREADRVADSVMSASAAPVSIPPTITPLSAQRAPAPPTKKDEEIKPAKGGKAQRKAAPAKPAEEEKRPAGTAARAQRKAAAPTKAEEEKKGGARPARAQREAAAGARGGTASAGVDAAIQSMRAGPAPGLDGATRSFMESRFGRDFGGVRVHHDTGAAQAADALGARAFTTGNDIFFNRGEYRPASSAGRRLLAHELTHTVQQSGASGTAARTRIQRNGQAPQTTTPSSEPAPTGPIYDVAGFTGAKIDTTPTGSARGTITIPSLGLPEIAGALKGTVGGEATPVAASGRSIPARGRNTNFTINAPMPHREDTVASATWTRGAAGSLKSGIETKLNAMKTATPDAEAFRESSGQEVYFLTFTGTASGRRDYVFIGTFAELAESDALLRPQWSPRGTPLTSREERLDADHFLEAQLGGADSFDNMWLLQASYNRSVGSQIAGNIRSDIDRVISNAGAVPEAERPARPAVETSWNIVFTNVERGSGFARVTSNYWTSTKIGAGDHLDHLKLMNERDLIAAGIRPEPGQRPRAIKVFPTATGGRMFSFGLNGNNLTLPRAFFSGITLNSATLIGDPAAVAEADTDLMSLNVSIFKFGDDDQVIEERRGDIIVRKNPRLGIAGYITRESIRYASRTNFTKLSPLTFSDLGISPDGELVGTGNVLSSKAVFPNLNVPLVVQGNRIAMYLPVPQANFSLGPLRVTETTLAVGAGENGLFVEGAAAFELGSLGRGSVVAELSAHPRLTGTFDLNMDFLDPARVSVTYDIENDALSAQATLGVQQGRIPGLESGQVTVNISRETVSVSGTLNLGGPLRGTVVNVSYSEAEGLRIGADNIPLPLGNLPAVQNATLSISATQRPDGGGWSFAGTGQATLAVPGATGTLAISYQDGAVTFTGGAEVAKGPAAGTLNFTATNRAIDEAGQPVEGPPTDTISVWGRGSVTIRFGNLLTGTAGVELTPDNRIIISGTIGLPPVFEVFPRREYSKDLFTLEPPEFPIWGVSVAGIGVGIFAFVNARVFFTAYVGPGEIRNAQIGATMDLDRPEDATITGHAEFHVPAYAGLGLDVGGGLRARLAVAYAEGRVGLTGELGIQADASASIDIAWNRNDGLSLSADLSAQAQPKFRLSANASVTVGVDLLLTEVSHTFGPWSRVLGEFGPDMTLGVRMPVRWSEAEGLDLSLDNIEIQRPSLDASALMSSVFDRLAG